MLSSWTTRLLDGKRLRCNLEIRMSRKRNNCSSRLNGWLLLKCRFEATFDYNRHHNRYDRLFPDDVLADLKDG
jgi:hypothetical protein